MDAMDTGLLILRVVVGLLMVGHGAQKLFGWHRGYGLRGSGAYLAGLGYRPGVLFALIAGLGEFVGGALLALGLVTPVATVLLVATLVNVGSGHTTSLWNHEVDPEKGLGGWEYLLVLGAVPAAIGFTGPGGYALDDAFGWSLAGTDWGTAALAAGLVAGLMAQGARLLTLSRATAQPAA
jgi:putative oxidoreductase